MKTLMKIMFIWFVVGVLVNIAICYVANAEERQVKVSLTFNVVIENNSDIVRPFMVELYTDAQGNEYRRLSY